VDQIWGAEHQGHILTFALASFQWVTSRAELTETKVGVEELAEMVRPLLEKLSVAY